MSAQHFMPSALGFEESLDPHLESQLRLDRLARYLDLEPSTLEQLRHNERETTCTIPLLRENGRLETRLATAVQHSHAAGPALATFNITASGYLNELRASAFTNTVALALFGIPNAGAAATLVADLDQMTEREIRRLVRSLAAHTEDLLGTHLHALVPARDLNDTITSWLASELADIHSPLAIAVPPSDVSLDHLHAIGIVESLRAALRARNRSLQHCRVAIQGYGALARALSNELSNYGASVIALADRSGGLLRPDGLDLRGIEQHVHHAGVLIGFPEAEALCNADVLECDCDALILAAAPWQITARNVENVHAAVIVEVEQHALSATASEQLEAHKQVLLIPSIVCEGARLHAATAQLRASRPASGKALEAVVRRGVRNVMRELAGAQNHWKAPLGDAAHLLALSRTATIVRSRSPFV